MTDTPATLLHRLCAQPSAGDWERFVRLFTPLLERWARRLDVAGSDAEDLLQEIFVLLIRKLPDFRYDPARSFRAWLWTVFRHAILAWRKRQPRAGPALEQLDELTSSDSIAEATEAEYRRFLLGRIVQIVQTDFPPTTWQIFQHVAWPRSTRHAVRKRCMIESCSRVGAFPTRRRRQAVAVVAIGIGP